MMKIRGFTLMEVMVALMILAIALTAIFRVIYEDNQIAYNLQQKNLTHQIGKYIFNRYQLEYEYNTTPEKIRLGNFSGTINMFKKEWFWRSNISKTSERNLIKSNIAIYEDQKSPPITTIEGFLVIHEKA